MLRDISSELHHVLGPGILIQDIPGGAINKSYRVSRGQTDYFVKVFDTNAAQHLDRQALFFQQKKLAQLNVAPKPHYLAKSRTFQLDEWVNAPNLQQCGLGKTEICRLLGETLKRIHHLEIDLPRLALAKDWQYYLHAKQNNTAQTELSREDQALLDYWQQETQKKSVVCHNDLAFSHITNGSPSLVFDWEYSALGSPYFDLASSILINQLNEGEQLILLQAYVTKEIKEVGEVMKKVAAMMPVVKRTYDLWQQAF